MFIIFIATFIALLIVTSFAIAMYANMKQKKAEAAGTYKQPEIATEKKEIKKNAIGTYSYLLALVLISLAVSFFATREKPVKAMPTHVETALAESSSSEESSKKSSSTTSTVSDEQALRAKVLFNIGEHDKMQSLTLTDKNLYIKITIFNDTDLSDADIASSRCSSITDALLEVDAWDTVTIDFGAAIGKVTMNRSQAVDDGYGKYFRSEEFLKQLGIM